MIKSSEQFPKLRVESTEESKEHFGKVCERAMKEIILLFGKSPDFFIADEFEDMKYGVRADAWLKVSEWRGGSPCCVPVQFSIREDIKGIQGGEKGKEALGRGSIPYWIDRRKIELWLEDRNKYMKVGEELALDFQRHIERVVPMLRKLGRITFIRQADIDKWRQKRKEQERRMRVR